MIAYRRFGDQPLIRLMRTHRYGYKLLADKIGVSRAHLVYAARGISAPSPELRTKLSNFFGVAPGKLFSTAALAAKYYEYQIGDIVCWQRQRRSGHRHGPQPRGWLALLRRDSLQPRSGVCDVEDELHPVHPEIIRETLEALQAAVDR
jgi:hypothetical protein